MKLTRDIIKNTTVDKVIELVLKKLQKKMTKKGMGGFVSSHEGYGVVMDEFVELGEAVHDNDIDGVINEIVDIAVAAIWSIASFIKE